ncbi:MAG: DUF2550 domain-containing protein [Actinomycetes bacterium]
MSLVLALDVLAALVVALLLALGALAVRRRFITRSGGTFDCSLRLKPASHGKGWALGVGRYAGDSLEWHRVFSYSARPRRVMARRDLEVLERREPDGPEIFALLSGAVVVVCRQGSAPVELAMSPDALTGFLSWLESAPPGRPG